MPSSEGLSRLLANHGATLLELARSSIEHGLSHGRPPSVVAADFHEDLRAVTASFVTLKANANLRGCVGSSAAWRALVEDVVANAFAAAFEDHRFPPLTAAEQEAVDISVSVLSKPEVLPCRSQAELLRALRPGVDGLIIEEGKRRGLFLPVVWEVVPDPVQFLAELKRKAGLPEDHWSPAVVVRRFVARSVSFSGAIE